jgi:hypothetical protein
MLGEKVGEGTGKVTSQRVLPNPDGAPKMETSFQGVGTLLGVSDTETGTYIAVGRPDGSLFGEGQGIVMGRSGELATWTGQGVGKFQKDGTLSYRGAIYVQTASTKWAQLNGAALVFEYEVDPQGNTRSQLFEWK